MIRLAPFGEVLEIQEIRRRHRAPDSRFRRTSSGLSHPSGSHPGHGPGRIDPPGWMPADQQHQASSSSQATDLATFEPSPSPRRGRPLPLPPPSTARVGMEEAQPTNGLRIKPYTTPLPTIRQKAPFSVRCTKLPASTSKMRPRRERSPPPKRQKIHTITSEPRMPGTHDKTDGNIVSQDSHHDLPPSPLPRKEDNYSTAPGLPQVPPTSSLVTPPTIPSIATSPVNVKREPESLSPLVEGRKAVTSYVTRFPLPDNCKKEQQGWTANRRSFRIEKARELEKKGLVLVGPHILRCVPFPSERL